MIFQRFIFMTALYVTIFFNVSAAPVTKYLPQNQQYNNEVPTPTSVLGFGLGERHIRYDQLTRYFDRLAQYSERVQITKIGLTNQFRSQYLVTISSKENLLNLSSLLAKRKDPQADSPLVVWLGYSVHGDEISGANAAMVVAYHLAASQNKRVKTLLANTIIVLEPSINPDGMDRFVNWVTNYRGKTANADPDHIEHHQAWITGRTNHYGFDLNRDWLLLSQQESQHRLKYFYLYQPNVLADFHEMGANSSYFFQPGIASRTHPLTPQANIELTNILAKYHAKTLDDHKRLYFSQESFDDFYYGKGSTFPDINGAIGLLFEQASSRGYQQQTINGLLTFEFSIQNHVLTSLSTIEGAWQNRKKLAKYRSTFYQQAEVAAKKEKFTGYLIHQDKDNYRLNAFLDKLQQHQIKIYALSHDFRHQGKIISAKNSYFIPIVQPQYRLIQALFNQETNFQDNTFYDVSGWTMPLAMNIEFYPIERAWGLKLEENVWQPSVNKPIMPSANAYAYAFEWHNFLAPELLNDLLSQGIKARVATKTFSSDIKGAEHLFQSGSIIIPAGLQTKDHWQKRLFAASKNSSIQLFALNTGLTPTGIDLGSRSFAELKPIKVLLVGGVGISQYEAGEVLFYLDDTLHIPVSVIEHSRLANIDFSKYSHIILVDGDYTKISTKVELKLTAWLKAGGTLFAQQRAAKWLSDKELLKVDFVSDSQLDHLFSTDNLKYQDREKLAARKRIAGAIFASTLDLSHPLTYGYQQSKLPVFRNSTLIMEQPSKPFIAVANYQEKPLMSGYSDKNLVNIIARNPVLVAHNVAKGRIIATTDDFIFRGYWYGSAKLLANSLFFSKVFNTPINE